MAMEAVGLESVICFRHFFLTQVLHIKESTICRMFVIERRRECVCALAHMHEDVCVSVQPQAGRA